MSDSASDVQDDVAVDEKIDSGVDAGSAMVESASIYELHNDPFRLKSDTCLRPGCKETVATMVPCLACFGRMRYCSEDCMMSHYNAHRRFCIADQCKAMRGAKTLPELRTKQIKSASFQKLLRHVVQNVDRKTMLASLIFIRLPTDPLARFPLDHPVKKVPREGAAKVMSTNLCLRETSKRWLRHVASSRGVSPFLYFFAYPQDYSFCFMMSVPFEEQEKFDEATTPSTEFVVCPCEMHSGGTDLRPPS